ncbi:MAG: dihydrolipoyl dehydrogenase family protein, partial [Actinomycetota bacterium]
ALAQRDFMTGDWDDAGQIPWLEGKGIKLVRGTGRLTGTKSVEVSLVEGATRSLVARAAVVLACGTTPAIPPIEGLADAAPWDNRDATSVRELPRSLLVLGGGAIGAEMAQCLRRLGVAEVIVVEGGPRLLGREEPFAGEQVRVAFEAEGISVLTGVRMQAVARRGTEGPITATLGDGRTIAADEILVAVGRRPNTARLGLETVGLAALAGKFLAVDRQLRVKGAGDWLYAVGDCNGLALLTHMGKYQARLAGDVICGRDVADVADYGKVPRVTFTDPQVCAVGLTVAEARKAAIDVRAVSYPTGDVAGAYTLGNGIAGTSQLVIDEARRVVVGATFTGPGTQELLHSATIAVVGEVPLERLWHAVPSFPTVSEVWLRLLEEHGY